MAKPVIGLSSYGIPAKIPTWTVYDTTVVPDTYTRAVVKSGGIPIIIPSFNEMLEGAESFFEKLDGIIIIGGTDINPNLYNEAKHEKTNEPDNERDNMEVALTKYALESNTPILGICRGMQLLNVLQGGSLYQHLLDIDTYDDIHLGKNKVFSYHNVNIKSNTLSETLLGSQISVPSSHHQGIKEVGKDLIVTGQDDKGLVEAFEHADHKFCIGVQWHPEEDYKNNKKLFDALVQHARERNSR